MEDESESLPEYLDCDAPTVSDHSPISLPVSGEESPILSEDDVCGKTNDIPLDDYLKRQRMEEECESEEYTEESIRRQKIRRISRIPKKRFVSKRKKPYTLHKEVCDWLEKNIFPGIDILGIDSFLSERSFPRGDQVSDKEMVRMTEFARRWYDNDHAVPRRSKFIMRRTDMALWECILYFESRIQELNRHPLLRIPFVYRLQYIIYSAEKTRDMLQNCSKQEFDSAIPFLPSIKMTIPSTLPDKTEPIRNISHGGLSDVYDWIGESRWTGYAAHVLQTMMPPDEWLDEQLYHPVTKCCVGRRRGFLDKAFRGTGDLCHPITGRCPRFLPLRVLQYACCYWKMADMLGTNTLEDGAKYVTYLYNRLQSVSKQCADIISVR
jgi:hypothetical protein